MSQKIKIQYVLFGGSGQLCQISVEWVSPDDHNSSFIIAKFSA